jgi:hypothetical protein
MATWAPTKARASAGHGYPGLLVEGVQPITEVLLGTASRVDTQLGEFDRRRNRPYTDQVARRHADGWPGWLLGAPRPTVRSGRRCAPSGPRCVGQRPRRAPPLCWHSERRKRPGPARRGSVTSSTASRSWPCSSTNCTKAFSMAAWVRATRRCDREPYRRGGAQLLGISRPTQSVGVCQRRAAADKGVTCFAFIDQGISRVLMDPRHSAYQPQGDREVSCP